MDEVSRRGMVLAAAAGAVGLVPGMAHARDNANEQLDRERVLACGFTEAEADCWIQLGRAAGMLLDLPKLHPMDEHELAHAIHVLQFRLMSRPAYRKYRPALPPEKP